MGTDQCLLVHHDPEEARSIVPSRTGTSSPRRGSGNPWPEANAIARQGLCPDHWLGPVIGGRRVLWFRLWVGLCSLTLLLAFVKSNRRCHGGDGWTGRRPSVVRFCSTWGDAPQVDQPVRFWLETQRIDCLFLVSMAAWRGTTNPLWSWKPPLSILLWKVPDTNLVSDQHRLNVKLKSATSI